MDFTAPGVADVKWNEINKNTLKAESSQKNTLQKGLEGHGDANGNTENDGMRKMQYQGNIQKQRWATAEGRWVDGERQRGRTEILSNKETHAHRLSCKHIPGRARGQKTNINHSLE